MKPDSKVHVGAAIVHEDWNVYLTLKGVQYIVLEELHFELNGNRRSILTVRNPRGRMKYTVVKYEDGSYSSATIGY